MRAPALLKALRSLGASSVAGAGSQKVGTGAKRSARSRLSHRAFRPLLSRCWAWDGPSAVVGHHGKRQMAVLGPAQAVHHLLAALLLPCPARRPMPLQLPIGLRPQQQPQQHRRNLPHVQHPGWQAWLEQ